MPGVVPVEDAAGEGVGDEALVALEAPDVAAAFVKLADELTGCHGLVGRQHGGEELLHGGSLDDGIACGVGPCRGGDELLGEVAVIDVEGEGELVVAGDALDALDDGGGALVGEAEDVAGDGEEPLADGAGGALGSADEVVADAQEGGLVVVEVLPDHEVEVSGEVVAAVGGEVVEVVDDDERRVEIADGVDDAVQDALVALGEGAEGIEADEPEIVLGGAEVPLDVVDDAAAGVEGVDGVDPEHPGRVLLGVAIVPRHLDGLGEGISAADDGAGEHLGEGVGAAVAGTGEEGNLVLVEDGGPVDVDEGVGAALGEVAHVDVEAKALPGVELVGEEWCSVVVHGVFLF